MHKKAIIVIPFFNEASRLKMSFLTSFMARPDVELLLVNDGSSDETETLLNDWSKRYPGRASVLSLSLNQGKGEAVRQGVRAALRKDPASIGYVDCDGATPAEECLRLLESLEKAPEMVIAVLGSRVKLLGFDIRRHLSRHYSGRVFATAASCVLDLPVYDTQCGAKFFRVSPLFQSVFELPFHSRWLFDVELIGRLAIGIRKEGGNPDGILREVPLHVWHDIDGSKRRWWDYARAAIDLLRVMKNLARESALLARK